MGQQGPAAEVVVKIDPKVFRAWCQTHGLPRPVEEYVGIPGRRFRFDWAWPDRKVAVEVQGGIWIGGKHGRGSGIVRDHAKMNWSQVHGWRVLQAQPRDLMTATMADWLQTLLVKETR